MHLPGKGCIHCGYAFFSMLRQGCYKNAAILHGDLLSATNLQQLFINKIIMPHYEVILL